MRNAKFNAIRVASLQLDLLSNPPTFKATAAFVNTENGHTYGSTTRIQWSPKVWEKIQELRVLMEQELDATYFEDGSNGPAVNTGKVDLKTLLGKGPNE